MEKESNEKIEEILDIDLWKKLQNTFSESIGTVVYTIDNKGDKITKSREFPFFCQIIKSKDKGALLCNNCRIEGLEKLKKDKEKIISYHCHAGLLNIMVPIRIKNKQIGAVICGAIITDKADKSICKELSKKINVESEELIDAINSIPITKEEKIKEYSKILSLLSTNIPELVHQKKMSDRRIEELNILHKIAQSIGHMTELLKTLDHIKKGIKEILYIEDCSIIIFNNQNKNNKRNDDEKKERRDEKYRIEKLIEKEIIRIKKIIKIKRVQDDCRFKGEGVKYFPYEIIAIPLVISNNIIGCVIFYLYSIEKIKKEDLNFFWVLADQMSIAVLNAQNLEQIKNKAITDKLTGLYNREFFMNVLEIDIIRSVKLRSPLSITLLDIDDFKHYNDTHGHIKGDSLLKEIAIIIKDEARATDVVGRYGGEEFIIISPDTNSNVAFDIVENIRKKVKNNNFFGKEDQPLGRVTISAGLVTCMDKSLSAVELIKEADSSLYKAKADGKNKTKSTVIVDKDLYSVDVQKANNFNKLK